MKQLEAPYHALAADKEGNHIIQDQVHNAPAHGHEYTLSLRERRVKWLLYANTALLLTSICFIFLPRHASLTKHACEQILSPTSPLLSSLEFTEGHFTNYFNHSTIYRGPPNRERERAWLQLWDHPLIGVDDATVAGLNKTDQAKHHEAKGSDPNQPTYAASIEVFHQLRCLSLLRQATWPLSFFNESWAEHAYPYDLTDEISRRLHLDHCIETIRLSLMCYGDATPVLLDHRTDHKIPRMLDFNVHHKCRNFDKIVDYVQEHRVEVEDLNDGIC